MAFQLAKHHDTGSFDEKLYMERTKRNHYFIGGEEGQKEIRKLKVGVAGLGGMGSNVAETLVRMGVGHLRVTDPDTIERSNIQRQVIANESSVGKFKAEALRVELLTIAKDFELVTYTSGVNADTVEEFVDGCDIIIDEVDVYPLEAHVMLHKAARERGIPLYSAYIIGMGIRFYKFYGNEYTFENFIQRIEEKRWNSPTGQEIVDIFAPPYPDYLKGDLLTGFTTEINEKRAPIFGPAALIGHSIVCIRMLLDVLRARLGDKLGDLNDIPETPVMPEYLGIDFAEFKITKGRV